MWLFTGTNHGREYSAELPQGGFKKHASRLVKPNHTSARYI